MGSCESYERNQARGYRRAGHLRSARACRSECTDVVLADSVCVRAMSDLARVFGATLLALICIYTGWVARGRWEGLDVSVGDSAQQSQSFVTAAVEKNQEIVKAQTKADDSKARVQKIIEKVYVDKACPPGTGAVSDDLTRRLQAKFGTVSKD